MTKLTMDDPRLTWQVAALAEECSIEGNCSAIDDETDAETARWIRAQLDAGNEWAWCCVRVGVTFEAEDGEEFEGVAYLGCCSYKSREDFMTPDGYYPDMKAEAFEDLLRVMRAEAMRGATAERALN